MLDFINKTAANLMDNPKISILCYSSDTKKSFQIKGNVTLCKEGENFGRPEGRRASGLDP